MFPVGRKHESNSGARVIVPIITGSDLLGEFMFLLFAGSACSVTLDLKGEAQSTSIKTIIKHPVP